jgi:hypothetical protein
LQNLLTYWRQLNKTSLPLWLSQANNWSDLLTVALQAAIAASHISRNHSALLALCAVQVLLQFMRLGWYAILVERLGSLVHIIGQIFKDTLYAMFLLAMLYGGFVIALQVLSPQKISGDTQRSQLLLCTCPLHCSLGLTSYLAPCMLQTQAPLLATAP